MDKAAIIGKALVGRKKPQPAYKEKPEAGQAPYKGGKPSFWKKSTRTQ